MTQNLVWFFLAMQIGAATPPQPEPGIRVIRRQRQFAHLNQTHLMLFIDQLELYIQSGQGNATAPDPQMMLQYSKNGGRTWSAERWMAAGKVGQFKRRLRWMQLGQARNWTFRLTATDAAIWNLVECWANVREGSA